MKQKQQPMSLEESEAKYLQWLLESFIKNGLTTPLNAMPHQAIARQHIKYVEGEAYFTQNAVDYIKQRS
jgi:hypothetical protein